jgi:hypothetical protein
MNASIDRIREDIRRLPPADRAVLYDALQAEAMSPLAELQRLLSSDMDGGVAIGLTGEVTTTDRGCDHHLD